ncbi:MAG: hypothetical protein IPG00_13105 [Saprospiraceae bacterium]|nr:hypothetical protein [Saprospiraceae bacterium]
MGYSANNPNNHLVAILIAARYVNTAACGLTAALTPSLIAGCDASADVSVLIYPSEPALTAPANTCNAAFVLPAVTPVVGFTVQYIVSMGEHGLQRQQSQQHLVAIRLQLDM